MGKNIFTFFIFLCVLIVASSIVAAAPTGPTTTTNLGSSRYSTAGAANVSAVAGNVTEINFIANTITSTWQGYYGNITGKIRLGNSNNQSLYDWNLTSPSGQVYATRISTVPTWASIRCANQAEVYSEETVLGVNQTTDQDSVNRTFLNTTSFTSFYVGSVNINTTQNCRAVQLYNSSGASSSNFGEVLLSDASNMIYAGLISNPALGFDNRSHQFEMIVGENGQNGDSTVTPYYFYLELH